MRRAAALSVVLLMLGVVSAGAEQWGGMEPGVSTLADIRKLRGEPTRRATQKVDGYDTQEWIYEDSRAPAGIRRLVVDFGLMTDKGYQAEVVRTFRLEPRPGAFDREWILAGWGPPGGVGKDGDVEFYFYKEGLFVYFAPDGVKVTSMVFTPPQLPPPGVGSRR